MANTRCIANKLEEQRRQAQEQELQDLHKALMWAFESSQDQCNKINWFCDQPTQHIDKLPDSHQLTLLTYDRIEHQGQVEDKSVPGEGAQSDVKDTYWKQQPGHPRDVILRSPRLAY